MEPAKKQIADDLAQLERLCNRFAYLEREARRRGNHRLAQDYAENSKLFARCLTAYRRETDSQRKDGNQ